MALDSSLRVKNRKQLFNVRFLNKGMSLSGLTASKLLAALVGVIMLSLFCVVTQAEPPALAPEISRTLTANLGGFHQTSPVKTVDWQALDRIRSSIENQPIKNIQIYYAETEYAAPNKEKLHVSFGKFENDSSAYSYFTYLRKNRGVSTNSIRPSAGVGTASALVDGFGVIFFKGANVVIVTFTGQDAAQATALATLIAASLDNGEGEVPVLVKHLPNSESAEPTAIYAVSTAPFEQLATNQPILREINFDGGTEAVTATYGQSQLVIVEFTTPQFASDNDRRIAAKIQELKSQGQAVPTAYRRVGNYSVFVFNAPDEKTANALIDQVKYEQVVQWLGDDPHLYERVQRYVLQKTGGVVIAVLESSGLSVLLCLGVGGLSGALLFRRRRRARLRHGEAYSDAGGMVRLNLDEVAEGDAARLLQGRDKDD